MHEPKPPDQRVNVAPAPPDKRAVRVIFIGLVLVVFVAALNQTIVATALPTIGRDFQDFENLSWVVIAFLLTATAVAPLYGKLSDIHGRRTVMMVAIGIFVIGSIICALAPDILTLILGRGVQGLGGGGIMPLAQAVVADTITPRERGRYQAYMGTAWVSAGVGGPVLGGFISEHLHWTGIFWLNVPLGLAGMALTFVTLRHLPRYQRRHRLDLIGAGLMMAGATLLLLALTWGGSRFPWISAPILGLIAASFLITAAFGWRLTHAPEQYLPLEVLRNRIMLWGTLTTACTQGVAIGLTVYIPLYNETIQKLSASDSGLLLIPIIAMTTPGSMLAGRAMLYMHRYKWVAVVGIIATILAISALIIYPRMPIWGVALVLTVVGTGIGTSYPITTVSIQNAIEQHQLGVAMGAMNFFRALNSSLVVALMGAIVLASLGTAPVRGVGAEQVAATALARGLDLAQMFSYVFAVGAVFLILGLISLLLMEERVLRGPVSSQPEPPAPNDGKR